MKIGLLENAIYFTEIFFFYKILRLQNNFLLIKIYKYILKSYLNCWEDTGCNFVAENSQHGKSRKRGEIHISIKSHWSMKLRWFDMMISEPLFTLKTAALSFFMFSQSIRRDDGSACRFSRTSQGSMYTWFMRWTEMKLIRKLGGQLRKYTVPVVVTFHGFSASLLLRVYDFSNPIPV